MKKIILPIKYKYVQRIFDGTKKYEFRKIVPREPVSRIYFYCGYPFLGIVGWADIKEIICDSPSRLFEITLSFSGVSRKNYDEYFFGRDKAYAYRLGKTFRYKKVKPLEYFGLSFVPQGFYYIK